MKVVETSELTPQQKQAVHHLWNREYPTQLRHGSITELEGYLNDLHHRKHYLILDEDNEVQGWMLLFERAHESWFAMILNQGLQGKGWGTILLNRAKERGRKLNGWVIDHDHDRKHDGGIYRSPLAFYLKNGFRFEPDQRLENHKISAVKISWVKR